MREFLSTRRRLPPRTSTRRLQRAANPAIPAVFWDAFVARVRSGIGEFVDSLVPIYAAHFSQAELDGLLKFYGTPLGRRLSEVQPLIMQESMLAGQRWGSTIGRQVAESLMAAGVLKKPN